MDLRAWQCLPPSQIPRPPSSSSRGAHVPGLGSSSSSGHREGPSGPSHPPHPRHAWHLWSWEEGPGESARPPPADPSHGGTPLFRGTGAHPGVVSSLVPESMSPSPWAWERGRLARLPCSGLPVGLSALPPWPAQGWSPDDLTVRLSHMPLTLQPQLCFLQSLPSRLPSPAGLLLQEAFLDWEGIQHGVAHTWRWSIPWGLVGTQTLRVTFNHKRIPAWRPSEQGRSRGSKLTRWTFCGCVAGRADWGRGGGVSDSQNSDEGWRGPNLNLLSRQQAAHQLLLFAGSWTR